MTKQDIKKSIKELIHLIINNDFSTSSLLTNMFFNDSHYIGITIANFIIQKETIIKKSEEEAGETIYFDSDTYHDYLHAIKKLAESVKDNGIIYIDLNEVNLQRCEELSNNDKNNIKIIHILRNSIAHGMYEIDGDNLIINNPGFLQCKIPIQDIENFNKTCMSLYNPNNVQSENKDIAQIFKDFYASKSYKSNIIALIYTYALLIFADVQENSYDNIDITGLNIHYNMASLTDNYQAFKKEFQKKRKNLEEKKINYDKCQDEERKTIIANNLNARIDSFSSYDRLQPLKKFIGSRIRNTIMHGNCFQLDDNSLALFDKKNQADNKVNTIFSISAINLFTVMNSINGNEKEKSDVSIALSLIRNILLDIRNLLDEINDESISNIIEQIDFLINESFIIEEGTPHIIKTINSLMGLIIENKTIQKIIVFKIDQIIMGFETNQQIIDDWETKGEIPETYLDDFRKMNFDNEALSVILKLGTVLDALVDVFEYYLIVIASYNMSNINLDFIQAIDNLQALRDFNSSYEEYDKDRESVNPNSTKDIYEDIYTLRKLF